MYQWYKVRAPVHVNSGLDKNWIDVRSCKLILECVYLFGLRRYDFLHYLKFLFISSLRVPHGISNFLTSNSVGAFFTFSTASKLLTRSDFFNWSACSADWWCSQRFSSYKGRNLKLDFLYSGRRWYIQSVYIVCNRQMMISMAN